jgi:hypothetical protein
VWHIISHSRKNQVPRVHLTCSMLAEPLISPMLLLLLVLLPLPLLLLLAI